MTAAWVVRDGSTFEIEIEGRFHIPEHGLAASAVTNDPAPPADAGPLDKG